MNPRSERHCNGPVQLKDILRDLGIDGSRTTRKDSISKDEILDLAILLNTTKSVNEFLQEV